MLILVWVLINVVVVINLGAYIHMVLFFWVLIILILRYYSGLMQLGYLPCTCTCEWRLLAFLYCLGEAGVCW